MRRLGIVFLMMTLCFNAFGQYSDKLRTVEIGLLSTTHIIFTSDLTYVDISMPTVITAEIIPSSKNMFSIKALQEFDFTTTVSALEANGTLHTFQVKFNPYPTDLLVDTRINDDSPEGSINTQERPSTAREVPSDEQVKSVLANQPRVPTTNSSNSIPTMRIPEAPRGVNVTSSQTSNFSKADAPTLQEIVKRPQQIFHVGDKNFKVEAYCTNIFVYSDLIYVVVEVINKSDIGFEAGEAQFAIETKTKKKQYLESEKDVWAKSSYGTLSCKPRGRTVVGYTIPKFTLLKNEALRIYIYEKRGSRNLVLTLKAKDINYAVSPLR